jgi:hypothetical protein
MTLSKYYSEMYPKERHETPGRIAGVPDEIPNKRIANTSVKHHPYRNQWILSFLILKQNCDEISQCKCVPHYSLPFLLFLPSNLLIIFRKIWIPCVPPYLHTNSVWSGSSLISN